VRRDTKFLGRIVAAVTIGLLMLPASAWALAGGSTGSGGGGGSSGGFSGGGGSSCSGDDCSGSFIGTGIVILIIVVFLICSSLLAKWRLRKRRQRVAKVNQAATLADADDGYWDPKVLSERVRECFFPIQNSWENRNVDESRPFVSDELFERHKLQLDGLEKQGRVNRIQNLKLKQIELVGLHNVTDDGEDRFVARIQCSASDWMEDVKTKKMINGSKNVTEFDQFWSFSRHPEFGWVLDEIQQAEEGEYHMKRKIVNNDEGPAIYEQEDQKPPEAA
jgi:hypothetical protein